MLNKNLQESMDLFARAIIELYKKGSVDFDFEFQTEAGEVFREKHNLSRYLRKGYQEFSDLERKLFETCYGRVLDIGSGTGNYLPFMKQKSQVLGLEISPVLVEFGNKTFSQDLICGDFFEYDFKNQKFDTITFLENNLGICQDLKGLEKTIDILKNILSKKGQILIVSYKTSSNKKLKITPYLNSKKGEEFHWISFDEKSIEKTFLNRGFYLKKIDEKEECSLLQITHH